MKEAIHFRAYRQIESPDGFMPCKPDNSTVDVVSALDFKRAMIECEAEYQTLHEIYKATRENERLLFERAIQAEAELADAKENTKENIEEANESLPYMQIVQRPSLQDIFWITEITAIKEREVRDVLRAIEERIKETQEEQ